MIDRRERDLPLPNGLDRRRLSSSPEADELTRRAAKSSSLWSAAVNMTLGALQIAIGLASGSAALIADGAHSLTDLVSDFITLIVSAHSHKEADVEHPYGHRRFENAAGMALGGLVLAAGLGMIASAATRLSAPSSALADSGLGWIALGLAASSVCAKEGLFRVMLRSAQRVQSSMLVANAWHARSDALSSLAAFAGVGGSMLGFPLCDPLAAFAVGALVSKMGWSFFWPALQDLMDRGVDERELNAIRSTLEQTPGVMGSHALRTRKMGDFILVDVHLEVNGALTVAQGHDIAALARQRALKSHRLLDVMTHVDPVEVCELRLERPASHQESGLQPSLSLSSHGAVEAGKPAF